MGIEYSTFTVATYSLLRKKNPSQSSHANELYKLPKYNNQPTQVVFSQLTTNITTNITMNITTHSKKQNNPTTDLTRVVSNKQYYLTPVSWSEETKIRNISEQ